MNYEVRIKDQMVELDLNIKKKGELTEDAVIRIIQQLIGKDYGFLRGLTKCGIIYVTMTWTLQHVNKDFIENVDPHMNELFRLLRMHANCIIVHKGSFDW